MTTAVTCYIRQYLPAAALLAAAVAVGHAQEAEPAASPPPAPAAEAPAKPKNAWNEFETKWFTLRLGAAALVDGLATSQDDGSKAQVGDVDDTIAVRTIRTVATGKLLFKKPWDYNLSLEYIGLDQGSRSPDSEDWRWTDCYVGIPLGGDTKLYVGKVKMPESLERLEGGTVLPPMERAAVLDALIPSRGNGLKLSGVFPGQTGTWSAGWFSTIWTEGESYSNALNDYAARVSVVPVYEGNADKVVHLAGSYRYTQAGDHDIRFRSRPEAYQAPYFIDTDTIKANHQNQAAVEAAWSDGPLFAYGEGVFSWISSAEAGNPFVYGYYATVAYALTGEHRAYNRKTGLYGRLVPAGGASGPIRHAWEVFGRYSWLDATDGNLDGGEFSRITLGASNYINAHWRLEMNYGYGQLRKDGTDGASHFLQARVQYEL